MQITPGNCSPFPKMGREDALKAQGEKKGDHQCDKRLPIVKQLKVGGFIVEIDGDGAVVPRLCGCCGQGVTPRSSGLGS